MSTAPQSVASTSAEHNTIIEASALGAWQSPVMKRLHSPAAVGEHRDFWEHHAQPWLVQSLQEVALVQVESTGRMRSSSGAHGIRELPLCSIIQSSAPHQHIDGG